MNKTLSGFIYDGQHSKQTDATLTIEPNGDVYLNQQTNRCCQFTELQVSARIGNTARYLTLPDGSRFETQDNDTVDALCTRWQAGRHGLVHKLESNLKLVCASVIVLVGVIYVAVIFGIPLLSKQITDWLPTSIDEHLAKHSLPQLDNTLFAPSTLNEKRQQAITEQFEHLIPDSERPYTLLFRSGERVGANAFALPDGTIIITDDLVALAEDDDMIISVLLHEIGHVEHRHAVQNIVRQASLSALIVAITGDVNTASTLVLMLPNVLIQAQYSQEFEWQADTYALNKMLELGIDTQHFAAIMKSMAEQHGEQTETDDETKVMDYFSSHPSSAKRIERFQQASGHSH